MKWSLVLVAMLFFPLQAHGESSAVSRANRLVYGALGGGSDGTEDRVGLYLPYDSSVEAVYGSYRSRFSKDAHADMLLVRGRKFLGNSFYIAAETGLGRLRPFMDDVSKGERVGRFGFSLGNEWIYSRHVIIGCEWMGFTRDRNVDVERSDAAAMRIATITGHRYMTGTLGVTF